MCMLLLLLLLLMAQLFTQQCEKSNLFGLFCSVMFLLCEFACLNAAIDSSLK